jgi:hypothetical protein
MGRASLAWGMDIRVGHGRLAGLHPARGEAVGEAVERLGSAVCGGGTLGIKVWRIGALGRGPAETRPGNG